MFIICGNDTHVCLPGRDVWTEEAKGPPVLPVTPYRAFLHTNNSYYT